MSNQKKKKMQPFKVICIDDRDKPETIPSSKWIKRGKEYTVIQVDKIRLQGGMLGFKLAEINIDDCVPYQYFAARRFGIPIDPSQLWVEQELDRLLKEAQKETLEEAIPV